MPQDQFLFVNKTAQSASLTNNRNDAQLLKKANNHVQPTHKVSKIKSAKIESVAKRLVGWSQTNRPVPETSNSAATPEVFQRTPSKPCDREEVVDDAFSALCPTSTCQTTTRGKERRPNGVQPRQSRSKLHTSQLVYRETGHAGKTALTPPASDCLADLTWGRSSLDGQANVCSKPDTRLRRARVSTGNKRLCTTKDLNAANHENTPYDPIAANGMASMPSLNEICGALDPFLNLPIELTLRERSLLQFYLTEGIPLLFQTSAYAPFTGANYIFSLRSSTSASYVVTKIIVTEWLHCTLKSSELSGNFLRRKAEVYRYVNDLVNDEDRNVEELLFGLVSLQVMDWTAGTPRIQRMHLQAIDTVLNDTGSMLPILESLSHFFYPSIIACQYTCVDLHLKNLSTVEQVKLRFFRAIQHLRNWHDSRCSNHDSTRCTTIVCGSGRHQPAGILEKYLSNLIDQVDIGPDLHLRSVSATMALVLWLCLTLSAYGLTQSETETYKQLIERYVEGASLASSQHGPLVLHPTQAISIIAYTSDTALGQIRGLDSRYVQSIICADTVDGIKILPYLSCTTRQRLLSSLVSLIANAESSFPVTEDMLAKMSAEIATTWWRRNQALPKEGLV